MPSWVVVVVAVATPLLAFAGALVGHLLVRKSDRELDHWRRRAETMRLLRWAVELATDPEESRSRAGVLVLDALLDSEFLQSEDVELVATIAGGVALDTVGPGISARRGAVAAGQRPPG